MIKLFILTHIKYLRSSFSYYLFLNGITFNAGLFGELLVSLKKNVTLHPLLKTV